MNTITQIDVWVPFQETSSTLPVNQWPEAQERGECYSQYHYHINMFLCSPITSKRLTGNTHQTLGSCLWLQGGRLAAGPDRCSCLAPSPSQTDWWRSSHRCRMSLPSVLLLQGSQFRLGNNTPARWDGLPCRGRTAAPSRRTGETVWPLASTEAPPLGRSGEDTSEMRLVDQTRCSFIKTILTTITTLTCFCAQQFHQIVRIKRNNNISLTVSSVRMFIESAKH